MDEIYSIEHLEQLRGLADPHRLAILRRLMQSPCTITQIGRGLSEEPAKVRYHVKELERLGLVQLVEKREKGGALEKYYEAVARSFLLNLTILSADAHEGDLNTMAIRVMQDLMAELGCDLRQRSSSPSFPRGWPVFHTANSLNLGTADADAFALELRELVERYKSRDQSPDTAPYGMVTLLYRPPQETLNNIIAIGSHDLTLDLLSRRLTAQHPDLSLSTTHSGSLEGLMALHRGAAHLAGCHLLDPETGEYNVPYVRRLLPGKPIVLVNLVYRQQGLMVPPGNPKGIEGLPDLMRPDIRFINREPGSGTRVLLDRKLREEGLDPDNIQGYEREEYTHLAVAAAVADGRADTGLGILAAARAHGLDFIPLAKERYDLVIPRAYYESELLQPFLNLLRSSGFRSEVEALGGYDVSEMGLVVAKLEG